MFSSVRRGFGTKGGGDVEDEDSEERALMVKKWGLLGGRKGLGFAGLTEIRWGWKMEDAIRERQRKREREKGGWYRNWLREEEREF